MDLKANFPETSTSDGKTIRRYEYTGEYTALLAALPNKGDAFGSLSGLVTSASVTPITGTNPVLGELSVTLEEAAPDPGGDPATGQASEELDWVMISRPLLEHPDFILGGKGKYTLTSTDITAIEFWRNEKNAVRKAAYKYLGEANGNYEAEYELSDNARKFAQGIQKGIETWEDYAPVSRRTTPYFNSPPSSSDAGLLDTQGKPASAPNGYEYRKSADRFVKSGASNRWENSEEWLGCDYVLLDRGSIYW